MRMMPKSIVIAALVVVCLGVVQGREYEPCRKGETAEVVWVSIEGCPESSDACVFREGESYKMSATFIPSATIMEPVVSLTGPNRVWHNYKYEQGTIPADREMTVELQANMSQYSSGGNWYFTVFEGPDRKIPHFCVKFTGKILLA